MDLTKEDVTGTSTDSLLVVSNELHKNVVARQNGTIRAHRAKSGNGGLDADAGSGDGGSALMPGGATCMIEQVLLLHPCGGLALYRLAIHQHHVCDLQVAPCPFAVDLPTCTFIRLR